MSTDFGKVRTEVAAVYSLNHKDLEADASAMVEAAKDTTLAQARAIYDSADAQLDAPLVPNLEQQAFSSYPEDPDIRDRLVEQNFDDAWRQLQYCLAVRRDYSELAKLFVDTRLKSEEFFRLDDIHKQEVKAGLYEMNLREAQDEIASINAQLTHANAQADLIAGLKTGALSDGSKANYATWAGELSEASTNVNAPVAKIKSTQIATYRSSFDQASWDYSERSAKLLVEDLKGRLATATRKAQYYQKDVTFRATRAAVSRRLAYRQLYENARHSSILNYAERLEQLRKQHNEALAKVVPRVRSLASAARSLYLMKLSAISPDTGHILDTCNDWLQAFQELLIKYKRRERVFVYMISLRKNINKFETNVKTQAGVTIDITPNFTGKSSGLLRGFALEYDGGSGPPRPITVDVIVPPATVDNIANPGRAQPKTLTCGRVLPIPNSLDLRPTHTDIVWNGSPYGNWTFSLNSPQQTPEVDDILLYLWVAFPS